MLEDEQYMKLLLLFVGGLFFGLPWNNGHYVIIGIWLFFNLLIIISFVTQLDENKFFKHLIFVPPFQLEEEEGETWDPIIGGIKYLLFYLFLVFWGLIISWSALTQPGNKNYRITSKTLASKRPVYFIFFSFIILILIVYLYIFREQITKNNHIYKIIAYSFVFSLSILIKSKLNLLFDANSCREIKEQNIVQSFDCEELKINKIDD